MQSTIKSFFRKNANSSTTSLSAANTSSPVAPVKLVSYITTNSPSVAGSRPLKIKIPDSKADYSLNILIDNNHYNNYSWEILIDINLNILV